VSEIDDEELRDEGLGKKSNQQPRTCIVTRQKHEPQQLIRFVLAPNNEVTPDLAHKLPGRGAYVVMNKEKVGEAAKKNAFSKAFKQSVTIPQGLAETIATMLRKQVVEALAIANKAGLASFGYENVLKLATSRKAKMIIHASEGSERGFSKINSAISAELTLEMNEPLHFSAKSGKEANEKNATVLRFLNGDELALATGKSGITHIGLKEGQALRLLLERAQKYQHYVGIFSSNERKTDSL
jgi:predicted RNA-binding protein YlxR (DUF448 family)